MNYSSAVGFVVAAFLSVFLCSHHGVESFPTGAPPQACVSMTPGHGVEQTSVNPYSIRIVGGLDSYTPGSPVKLRVAGNADFQGMLLQARRFGSTDATPVGTFLDPDVPTSGTLRLLQCTNPGDAVTHVSAFTQTIAADVELTWTPPTQDVGQIYFVATVAQERFTWWKGAESSALTFSQVAPIIQKRPGCSSRCGRCRAACFVQL